MPSHHAEFTTPRVAVITGAGRRRVGHAIACSLASQGYSLALHYHQSERAAIETKQELSTRGSGLRNLSGDVAVESEVAAMFHRIHDRFGRVDVLVTTASVWERIPLEDTTADDLWRNFNINTLGTFLCAREAGLRMVDQSDGGCIVTMGDWAIQRPYRDFAAYFVSKGAIPTLTQTMAVELGSRNPKVRVNCIHPGPVMFPPDATPEERAEMIQSTLVQDADQPDWIAQAVLFLIENTFVTGACIPVDGGRSIYALESSGRGRPI